MIFQRPELVPLAPLAALLFTLVVSLHWRRVRRLVRAYRATALPRLLPAGIDRFPSARLWCLVGAGALVALAAAGPRWPEAEPPEPPQPLDVTLAVDLSLSMTAADAAPSRIGRAREAIDRLTEELPSARFSLVVFAGWPLTLVPPTDDGGVVRYFAGSLRPEIVEELDRGNALAAALGLAAETVASRPRPDARRVVLVLSDGDLYEDEESLTRAAAAAANEDVEVWVAGVGTEDGAPMSVGAEPVLDARGRPRPTRQHVDLLRAVADAGDGVYRDVTGDDGLRSLVADLRDLGGDTGEAPPEPFDGTALLALLAIPLLLFEGALDAGRTAPRPKRTPS